MYLTLLCIWFGGGQNVQIMLDKTRRAKQIILIDSTDQLDGGEAAWKGLEGEEEVHGLQGILAALDGVAVTGWSKKTTGVNHNCVCI